MTATKVLPCVELEPRAQSPRGAVIWLHGLGASGHDFEPIVPMLRQPELRFVFPHAPALPVTINGGMVMPAWYDIRRLDLAPYRESETDIRRSATLVEALLRREKDRGIPAERIVLAGFSQGAAMALHVGLRHAEALCGLIILSGYHVLPQRFEAERSDANRRTPILFGHGIHDPVLPVVLGREAHDFVTAQMPQADIRWHQFPIAHSVSEAEIEIVAQWLAERFG
ncbi:alpha/beta hydrolase [Paraliomyxa miuraensis]|uniref:alpha/beta hydrolase n=1 Tax=Paraliomyxa miuraensis TaxID=376150 RepID=UPI00224C902D|nr:carboxylesterase [Paraliomyxa miuraensis]MCX4243833.1 alpha/beta hydrolase [Paraliomyxa miuraensis]